MAVCLKHTDREATTACSACHKPICPECVVRRGRNVYCSEACLTTDHPQLRGGIGKVADHVFITGSLAALAGAFLVPLGHRMGTGLDRVAVMRIRWVYGAALAATAILWAAGPFVL